MTKPMRIATESLGVPISLSADSIILCSHNTPNMRIAVNTRHLHARLEGVGTVTDEVMKRMSIAHPEDSFDYYFDQRPDPRFIHGPNVHPFSFFPPTRLPFLIRYWLNHRVRPHTALRKADVFFSPDGFIPLGMRVPKVSMVHDVAYLRYPEMLQPWIRHFYATWMPRFLAYTDHIITVSEFSKAELIDGFKLPADKISVVYNGVSDIYKPHSSAQQMSTRLKYTGGKPFMLYLGSIHPRKNITTLLKAYEHLQAHSPTDIQLILAGRPSWHTKELMESITQSPMRGSIHMTGYVSAEVTSALLAAAELMVYPSLYEGFGLPVLESMACGTPVITSNVSALPEVAGDAALLFEPTDAGQLATCMEQLISDTSLRARLIAKGHERQSHFSWANTASGIYDILKAQAC